MRLPRLRPLPPTVPAAALADVTLLLVFFFLLATSFDVDRTKVDLPVGPQLVEAAPGAACLVVTRRVTAEGERLVWRFDNGRGVSQDLTGPDGLFFEVSRVVEDDPERTFLLRIDSSVRFSTVDDALEMLRKAGVRNVVFGARAAGGA
jgi:biopolymer transport protein ExbD